MANVKLTDVCKTIFAGGDVPKDNYSLEQDEIYSIPIYTNGEQNNGLYGYTTKARVSEPSITVSARGTIGFTAIRTMPFYPAIRLITLTPNEKIDIRYLYYVTQNYKFDNGGTSIPQLTVPMLKNYSFPLPPLETQRQIAANLDKVTHTIDLCNAILEKLDQLVKSRFVEMFGDPEADTCTYETKKLKELSIKISDGVHAKPAYTESGRPFLSVVNINRKKVDFTDCKYVSEEAYQKMIKSTHPEKGDVLYTKVGATYGIPAYVDTDIEFCLYVSVCLIKPKHELINSKFLAIQMDMPFVKHQADRRIKGIGVPDLHLNQISEFDIICPPRELQDSFVAFVEQTDKSKLTVKQVLEKAETLKKALMQEYFG